MPSTDDITRSEPSPIDDDKDIAWQEHVQAQRGDHARWGLYLGAGAAGLGALIGGVSVFAIVVALRDDPAARTRAAKSDPPAIVETTGRNERTSPLAKSPVGRAQPCSYQDWLDKKCANHNTSEPPRAETTTTTTTTAAGPAAPATTSPAGAAPAPAEMPVQAPVVTRISPAPAANAPAAAPVQSHQSVRGDGDGVARSTEAVAEESRAAGQS